MSIAHNRQERHDWEIRTILETANKPQNTKPTQSIFTKPSASKMLLELKATLKTIPSDYVLLHQPHQISRLAKSVTPFQNKKADQVLYMCMF